MALNPRASDPYDLAIAGAGLTGLTLALAAASAGARVAVLDSGTTSPSNQAFAIAPGPQRMFDALGVWAAVAVEAEPIRRMAIADVRRDDPIRPVSLRFDGDRGAPLAFMVPQAALLDALQDSAATAGVTVRTSRLRDFRVDPDGVAILDTADGPLVARLAVAADGARSGLRDLAGISTIGRSYRQSGIVATIRHSEPHEGVARQHFLPGGPLAFLPLTGGRSSIVWTEPRDVADRLVRASPTLFVAELQERAGPELGTLDLLDVPRAYPLALQTARRLTGDRLALIGDAAHVIHPLAGQNLNLGLRDAAVLAELVADRLRLGLDPGAPDLLAAYGRRRHFDILATGLAAEGLRSLFAPDRLPIRLLRDLGLGLVDRWPGAKRALVGEAGGLAGPAPRLFGGGPL